MNLFSKTLLASAITIAMSSTMAAPYEIIDLGKIEGGTNSVAFGINNSGEVVGYGDGPIVTDEDGNSGREYSSHAIQFKDGAAMDLGALDRAIASFAFAINDNGNIIGYSGETTTETNDEGVETDVSDNFAVLYNAGIVTKVGGLESLSNVRAFDLNNNGYAIGIGITDVDPEDDIVPVERGFIVNALTGEGFLSIGALSDSALRQSYPLSINDNGTIVGWAEIEEGAIISARGFMTNMSDPTVLVELPNLGTPLTMARDVNNNDVIVGMVRTASNTVKTVAFVYNPNSDSELTQLPFFESRYDNSIANAINDSNQIVGQALVSVPTSGINTGFLYEDGTLKNLNDQIPCDSGWRIDNATNINNNGEIVGFGLRSVVTDGVTSNELRAFKLMPTGGAVEVCETPEEPDTDTSSGGSLNLFGLLLLTLFGFRRKKLNN